MHDRHYMPDVLRQPECMRALKRWRARGVWGPCSEGMEGEAGVYVQKLVSAAKCSGMLEFFMFRQQ